MRRKMPGTEPLVRKAFDLLIELRGHREAPRLLSKAIAFLQMLARDRETEVDPLLFSIRVVHVRRS